MKFTIYTRPGCPYCTKIKQVLGAKGFQYKEAVLGTDFNRDQFYAEFGRASTFPQVLLDSKRLGGCTESVKYLRENKLI